MDDTHLEKFRLVIQKSACELYSLGLRGGNGNIQIRKDLHFHSQYLCRPFQPFCRALRDTLMPSSGSGLCIIADSFDDSIEWNQSGQSWSHQLDRSEAINKIR